MGCLVEVCGRERPAFEQRNAQGLQEIWPGGEHVHLLRRLFRLPFHVDVTGPKAATQQRVRGVADRDYARKCGDLILQVAVKALNLRIPVFFQGGIDAEEQDVSGVETGIDAVEVFERSHHQARTNENNHGEPYLDDHERLLQMPSPARVPPSPGSVEAFSLSADVKSRRVLRNAGARPKTIPVRSETESVNVRARQSGSTAKGNGLSALPRMNAVMASDAPNRQKHSQHAPGQ